MEIFKYFVRHHEHISPKIPLVDLCGRSHSLKQQAALIDLFYML